jgi:hypothetical protein
LTDAVEFFQDALERLIQVERENEDRRKLLETLNNDRTDLTTKKFDMERKLSSAT